MLTRKHFFQISFRLCIVAQVANTTWEITISSSFYSYTTEKHFAEETSQLKVYTVDTKLGTIYEEATKTCAQIKPLTSQLDTIWDGGEALIISPMKLCEWKINDSVFYFENENKNCTLYFLTYKILLPFVFRKWCKFNLFLFVAEVTLLELLLQK